ncbi:MAG TPA: hypothetical protein DCY94_04820, partial [Firmicutes bacterium]|nr:hypothetical protein [Bacillota bacterium]
YGYQTFVNVFLLNLRDKYYTKGIKSLDECERYIMGLVETSWKRTNELAEGSEILMEYKEELEAIEYIDLPDPVDKVAEEIEIELDNAYEDGLENGLKKGHKSGVEEGSKRTLMAIVKNMQNAGRTLKEISDTICVPLKDIQKLCVDDK